MSIQYINTLFPGEIGVHPRLIRLVCNDTYATVTEAGYLGSTVKSAFPIYQDDFIFTVYGTKQFAIFNASISGNVITLVPYIPPTVPVVTGATVNGDVAKFNNTTGGLTDSGILAAALATFTGATVSADVATFNNTTGQLIDSGTALSALQLKANIHSNEVSYGGGSTSTTFTLTGATTSSLVWSWVIQSSNASNVVSSKVTSSNTVTVTFSADPGANTTIGYIAFIAPQ